MQRRRRGPPHRAIRRLGESRLELGRERERADDLAAKLAQASATIDDQARTLALRELALGAVYREHAAMAEEIATMRAVLVAGATGVLVLATPPGGWRN